MDRFVRQCGLGFFVMLLALIILVSFDHPPLILGSELNSTKENQVVQLVGVVSRVSEKSGVTFLSIKSDIFVDAVVFDPVPLKKGDNIIMTARVSIYKNEKELIVNSLKVVP